MVYEDPIFITIPELCVKYCKSKFEENLKFILNKFGFKLGSIVVEPFEGCYVNMGRKTNTKNNLRIEYLRWFNLDNLINRNIGDEKTNEWIYLYKKNKKDQELKVIYKFTLRNNLLKCMNVDDLLKCMDVDGAFYMDEINPSYKGYLDKEHFITPDGYLRSPNISKEQFVIELAKILDIKKIKQPL